MCYFYNMLHTEILASFSRTFHKINQFHSHVQELKVRNSGGPQHNHTWRMNGWLQQKLPMFGFRTHTTALWPMEQSSILSAKFDCPETHQNCSLLATAHMIVKLVYALLCCNSMSCEHEHAFLSHTAGLM